MNSDLHFNMGFIAGFYSAIVFVGGIWACRFLNSRRKKKSEPSIKTYYVSPDRIIGVGKHAPLPQPKTTP